MGDDNEKTASVETQKRVSVLEAFEISDLLPGGVVFEITQLETAGKGSMSEGDVSTIYTAVLQGFGMAKNKPPKGFTYSAVREHYNL